MVRSEGILLSTFPPQGKGVPEAHLNFPLQGRFDVFAHHVTQTNYAESTPTMYIGILLYNPGDRTVDVDVLQGASFLSTPDAPFRKLPSLMDNPVGYVYSGPGSRVMSQVLRGRRQTQLPSSISIAPRSAQILANLPIPLPKRSYRPLRVLPQFSANGLNDVLTITPLQPEAFPRYGSPSSNGRSTLMYLQSSNRVYAASLSMFARINPDGTERAPTLEEWQSLLVSGRLAAPRDISPTPIGSNAVRFFYGRVAGVSQGSQWQGTLTDGAGKSTLTIPRPGQAFSYGLSTVYRGTLGTGQVQSAPMLARYPDTAYLAHGNYAVHYNLKLPLYNPTQQMQAVTLAVQTPLKQDRQGRLDFLNPPAPQIFFRGTVRVTYTDDQGTLLARYVHLVQQRGQRGEPIVVLNLKPGDRRQAEVDFLYPPDATPPQVLTVSTLLPPNSVVTQQAGEPKEKVQPKPNQSAAGKKLNGTPK
jgi:hypothetical protein